GYIFIADLVVAHGKIEVLYYLCATLGASIFMKSLFRYMSSYFIAPFEQSVIHLMRTRLFHHLSTLSMSFFTGKRKGNIINVLVTDVQIVQESVIGTVQNMVSDPIQMILILGSLFVISWKLTLFTLIVLPLTGIFINFISKSLKRKARAGQERLGTLIAIIDEFVSGIRIVKAFRTEDFEKGRYEEMNGQYRDLMVSVKRRSDMASPLTEVLSVGVVITIILFGGSLIISGKGELMPSAFIGFVALFGSFIQPIKTFSSALSRIQRGVASFQRVEEFLLIPEDVKERPNAVAMPEFKERICFEDVSFAYESEEWVLRDVNLCIAKGQKIALVGPSGGGKSTLADLLPRYYDPVKGRITIDGQDIRDLRVPDLRGAIGVVTQEGILFNDTVLANIAYGDSKPNHEKATEAARIANALDFITQMPLGFDTMIGERGTKLSGGQRQRLSIARAIYKNAPILILDEATSALDSESERLVQEALEQLMEGRTSLVIAHRLSTILDADQIFVVEGGKIKEAGTHQELLAQGGLYRSLYDIQFGD
ncbi:MAG TPA: ABC transporter ATP-binding protein, partial [Bacteroidia bacterium]|nr:ABC transporter ATP-binding protein [Bacteroidia bacterium]